MNRKVTIHNASTRSGNFFLYQMNPAQAPGQGFISLVWKTAPTGPGGITTFRWQERLDFVWLETRRLFGGAEISAFEAAPARPPADAVLIRRKDGGYCFAPPASPVPAQGALIGTDGSVPAGNLLAGLGMDGYPAVARRYGPNESFLWPLFTSYWLCIGDGEVAVSGRVVPNPALPLLATGMPCRLSFPDNVDRLSVILREDNSWDVSPDFG